MDISLLDRAKQVFRIESDAILGLEKLLDYNFTDAVETILSSNGKVIVTGMGKSGIIGTKIASTFSSTGTPSFFMHPAEAFHGDLGMVQENDILLLLSYSGETEEVIRLLPYAKENKISVVSITGVPTSTLAKNSDFHICAAVGKEACPLQLAPTASTTATLVVGDALAIVLMKARNFKPENFAKYHPGGNLGRRLLSKVIDVMQTKTLAVVRVDSTFFELVKCMTEGQVGAVVVVDSDGCISGLVSSGDMFRAMKNSSNYAAISVENVLTKNPKFIDENASLVVAESIMREHEISVLLIQDQNKLKGILHINQC